MKVDKKAVGRKIQEFRLSNGYTFKEFGKLFNASDSSVIGWENGRSLPNKDRLYRLAKFMGVSVAELLATQSEEKEVKRGYVSSLWQPSQDYIEFIMGQ